MIILVIVSSDLRPYFLDTQVKRGAELSTNHYLLVSWNRWCGSWLEKPGTPKRVVKMNWECLAEDPVWEVSHILREFRDIESE